MKHTRQVNRYAGSHTELAKELGDLYYDSLADFLRLLADKLHKDALADQARGRRKLSKELHDCSAQLSAAANCVDRAWRICEPYMVD